MSRGPDEHVQQGGVTGSKDGSSRSPGAATSSSGPRSESCCLWPAFPRAAEQAASSETQLQDWPSASEISVC